MVIVSWGTLGGYEKGKKVYTLEVRILCMTKTRGSFTLLLINPKPISAPQGIMSMWKQPIDLNESVLTSFMMLYIRS